jgi:hypothetical protein
MALPTVTFTFTNGTVADADSVNTNFADLIAAMTDASKDFSISALTVAGTATLNGNVVVGNASSDDLSITASLASSIPVKTTNTYDIGSALLGLAGVYFGTADSDTARVVCAALAASVTYTMPDAGASANFVMSQGTATVAGNKTFSGTTTFSGAMAAAGKVNFTQSTDTIVTGDIDYTSVYMKIDTQDSSTTDNLGSINLGTRGDIVILQTAANARDVVVVNDSGNLRLAGAANFTLSNVADKIMLIFDGTNWTEISRSDNA